MLRNRMTRQAYTMEEIVDYIHRKKQPALILKASSILKKFRTEGVLIVDKKITEQVADKTGEILIKSSVPTYRVQKDKKEKGAETVAA